MRLVVVFCVGLAVLSGCVAAQKKGMAVQQDLYNCGDMDFLNVDWWWNWNYNKPCAGREYVPMIWGRGNIGALKTLPTGSEWLMAFNEPNNPYAGQDVMSPAEAASFWPQFEATGRKLVSPALALGGSMSYMDWLHGFFAACANCRVDAISIHIYVNNTQDVIGIINNIYNTFKKPVWLTEICVPQGSPDQNNNFLKQLLPQLNSMQSVQRYSWVADRWTFDAVARGAALLTPDTSKFVLTSPGTTFKSLPAQETN